jgi:hypothetical protein
VKHAVKQMLDTLNKREEVTPETANDVRKMKNIA